VGLFKPICVTIVLIGVENPFPPTGVRTAAHGDTTGRLQLVWMLAAYLTPLLSVKETTRFVGIFTSNRGCSVTRLIRVMQISSPSTTSCVRLADVHAVPVNGAVRHESSQGTMRMLELP